MSWIKRFESMIRREQLEDDLDDEVRHHLELKTRENIQSGMSAEDARRAALREFGGVEQKKEQCRDADRFRFLEDLVQDVRFGLRMLKKNVGFTIATVLILALGIGANTAIFTLINAALLRMLPVAHPEQLVTAGGSTSGAFAYPTYRLLRDNNQVFSGLAGFRDLDKFDVEVDGHAELATTQVVSGNYYSVLGVNAILGRTVTPEDDKAAGQSPVAVISYNYWVSRFNRDPSVVGKRIDINRSPFSVIGVTPPEFWGLDPGKAVEVTIPIGMVGQVTPWAAAGTPYFVLTAPFRNWLQMVGRLKPGVTVAQAMANVDPIYRQAMRQAADSLGSLPAYSQQLRQMYLNFTMTLEPGGRGLSTLRQQFSKPLMILLAVVGLLLIVVCANVASLMLARAAARQQEISVRVALGAGRARLLRQLLAESAVLALGGGFCGLLLAYGGTKALLALTSQSPAPITLAVFPDLRVLGFTLLVSMCTAILFGLAPALRATRLAVAPGLTQRGARALRGQTRVGKALVIAQVALSLMLLVGAGLLLRSLKKLQDFYPGFNARQVLLVSLNPSLVGYKEPEAAALYQRLAAELRALPGTQAVSFSDFSPLGTRLSFTLPNVEGYKPPSDQDPQDAAVLLNVIGPGYFHVLETPVLLGREFTDADTSEAPRVAIINRTMARNCFGAANPLGRHLSVPGWRGDSSWLEIVGVVDDVKFQSLRQQIPGQAYIPFLQSPESGTATLEVRGTVDTAKLAATVRRAILREDSRMPIFDIKTLVQQVDESLVQERLVVSLSGLFGALALLLASVGLYGLIAYGVTRRTNEIGIRMALGASHRGILGMVLREALTLVASGVALGIPLALSAARLIGSQLYDLKPTDPFTLAAAALMMVAVAAVAGYLPARNAARVDPLEALRYE